MYIECNLKNMQGQISPSRNQHLHLAVLAGMDAANPQTPVSQIHLTRYWPLDRCYWGWWKRLSEMTLPWSQNHKHRRNKSQSNWLRISFMCYFQITNPITSYGNHNQDKPMMLSILLTPAFISRIRLSPHVWKLLTWASFLCRRSKLAHVAEVLWGLGIGWMMSFIVVYHELVLVGFRGRLHLHDNSKANVPVTRVFLISSQLGPDMRLAQSER